MIPQPWTGALSENGQSMCLLNLPSLVEIQLIIKANSAFTMYFEELKGYYIKTHVLNMWKSGRIVELKFKTFPQANRNI